MLDKFKCDVESWSANVNNKDPCNIPVKDPKSYPLTTTLSNNKDYSKLYESSVLMAPSNLTPVKKVYLICPLNLITGGPEAMHQLCNKINFHYCPLGFSTKLEIMAYMLYVREVTIGTDSLLMHARNARPPDVYNEIYPHLKLAKLFPGNLEDIDYSLKQGTSNYANSYCSKGRNDYQIKNSDSMLIWPECWTHYMEKHSIKMNRDSKYLSNRAIHQMAIWWLSVDYNNNKFKNWHKRKDVIHLYQSQYAKNYIIMNMGRTELSLSKSKNNKFVSSNLIECSTAKTNEVMKNSKIFPNVLPMFEYIHERYIKPDSMVTRDIEVVYNPHKGMHFTDKIRRRSDKVINFMPIGDGMQGKKRISPTEVKARLQRAKIYIDFGHHPGMDRLPREAAMMNCVVITNKCGSAGLYEDVPIPENYKVDSFDVDLIHNMLVECLENYNEKVKDFDSYRKWISRQEDYMDKCVKRFVESTTDKPS